MAATLERKEVWLRKISPNPQMEKEWHLAFIQIVAIPKCHYCGCRSIQCLLTKLLFTWSPNLYFCVQISKAICGLENPIGVVKRFYVSGIYLTLQSQY